MYLLIGHDGDPCCQIVSALLRKHGHAFYMKAEPLAGDANFFCWTFDTIRSESSLCWQNGQLLVDQSWNGVLVRGTGEPTNPVGWEPADLAYVKAETQAALIAWLRILPCPVINRLTADLWFRPWRPLVEWRSLFERCGLPTLVVQITNDIAAAHRFSDHWHGEVTYAPLTSSTHYHTVTTQQWTELARLMEHLPVVLIEPYEGDACYACIVGQQVVWSTGSYLSTVERKVIEDGLSQLASVLQTDMVQIALLVGANGPRCIDVYVFPQFAVYSTEEQWALCEGIVTLLTGDHDRG
jgi:hypothetical protein